VRAIISATLDLAVGGEGALPMEVIPKILVPMLCTAHELEHILQLIDRVAYQVSNTLLSVLTLVTVSLQ